MEVKRNIICPKCKGTKEIIIDSGHLKGQYMGCWYCQGTGQVNLIDEIRGLLFDAMISDSVHLRQKCLWKYTNQELINAIDLQISCFEESIKDAKEEEYIIEEYRYHLERFKEWSEYFLMDAKVIYELRNEDGSEGNG